MLVFGQRILALLLLVLLAIAPGQNFNPWVTVPNVKMLLPQPV